MDDNGGVQGYLIGAWLKGCARWRSKGSIRISKCEVNLGRNPPFDKFEQKFPQLPTGTCLEPNLDRGIGTVATRVGLVTW